MKTTLLLILFLSTAAICHAEESCYVLARIVQIGEGGAIAEVGTIPENVEEQIAKLNADNKRDGYSNRVTVKDYWKPWGEVWIKGSFADQADGDFWRGKIVKDGTYSFTSIAGAKRTLHAWKVE